ncbi:MAG: trypsin-like peptidase domain-containing protein [Xanthobacteraceae bacterium]
MALGACRMERLADKPAGYAVKIELAEGHGSGVHIGGGYILTAAHVAAKAEEGKIVVKLDNGRTIDADLLWVNAGYDVALLRIPEADKIAVADLSCRDPALHSTIVGYGNPLAMEFLSTRGEVVSTNRKFGPWKEVYIVDQTIVMGMSGGPAIQNGHVVGIMVGVVAAPTSAGDGSVIGIGSVVPGSAICMLMGRT